jgi:hypothetical protein
MLCTPKTEDPLQKKLLEMHINPLLMARRQSPVGAIYLLSRTLLGRKLAQQIWRPDKALVPGLPAIGTTVVGTPKGQILTEISSSNLDLNTTAHVVGRMLPGLDDKGKVGLKAALAAANAASCSVRLVEPQIERILVDELQIALRAENFSPAFIDALSQGKAYFCTGGWSATALEITAVDKDRRSVKLAADLEAAVKASGAAGISLVEGAKSRKVFKSKEPLFFGAELMRIDRKPGGGLILTGYNPSDALAGEAPAADGERAPDDPSPTAEIWDEDDECLLDVFD